MTGAPPRTRSTTCHTSSLVLHDIHLERTEAGQEPAKVVASVECQRTGCDVRVETCARCPRFARIETHEAGYVLLCRAHDESIDAPACEPAEPEGS